MTKLKYFTLGFLAGVLIIGTAWAAQGLTLVNGSGAEIGTSANPVQLLGI